MDIEATITIYCGNLSIRDMFPIQSLASTLGAGVISFAGQDPAHVRVELRTVIDGTLGVVLVSNRDLQYRELTYIDTDIAVLAKHIRTQLVMKTMDPIRKQVYESLTPPSPYAETRTDFHDQKIFLASTGNRHRDQELTDTFDRYIKHHVQEHYFHGP